MNKKSPLSYGFSYEKDGELFRNNTLLQQVRKSDTQQVIKKSIHTNRSNVANSRRLEKPKVYQNGSKRHFLKKYNQLEKNTDKYYKDNVDETIKIKNASFSTSSYSIEVYHTYDAPFEFKGFVIDQRRKDKIIK